VAVENALTREALVREKERPTMLLEVNNTLVRTATCKSCFPVISGFMRRMTAMTIQRRGLSDEAAHSLSFFPLNFSSDRGAGGWARRFPVKRARRDMR